MSDAHVTMSQKRNEAEGAARQTVRLPLAQGLARFGYAAKGVVYFIMGWLAFQAAIGAQSGAATDRKGAIVALYQQPFGKFLLAVVAIGFVAYGLWNLLSSALDLDGNGHNLKGSLKRIGYAVIAFSYLGLALGTYKFILDLGSIGKSSDASTRDWTARLLGMPFGTALVVLVGLVIAGVAIALGYEAFSARFLSNFKHAEMPYNARRAVLWIGRIGLTSLAAIFAVIAIFLVAAALHHNPGEAKGLGGALQQLAHEPFGGVLLGLVALGLIAYGVYSLAEARYRRIAGL